MTTEAAHPPVHDLKRGIVLITIAFLFSAIMSAFSKAAAGVPPLLLLFFQYSISFLVFVPLTVNAGPQILKTDHLFLHVFRSLAGSCCQLLFFVAVKSLPLMDAVLLTNAAPLFIPLIVYVWFRKSVQPIVWLSLFIGLIGIVLIINPGRQMFQNPSSLIALGAGLCSALALVATNKLSETEPPTRILFYNFGISTLLLIPVCLAAWRPPSMREWLLVLAVGAFYAATQYFIILAYRYANAVETSPFNYTVVIFSGLLGWIFFGNIPAPAAILGTLLICAGGILSTRAGHREGLGHPFGTGHWSH
ncbi:MAG: DMT family transporter [Acidobacteriaceae bacterium]|nr:DMT family transporter [Acidobacteriaceae bacterium]MBV9441570.1 DMT family transporter [Acidobacteriaceae bacterium]